MHGPHTSQYGAVVGEVVNMSDISRTRHTAWARVAPGAAWSGFSMPPRHAGQNEQERITKAFQKQYNEELKRVLARRLREHFKNGR